MSDKPVSDTEIRGATAGKNDERLLSLRLLKLIDIGQMLFNVHETETLIALLCDNARELVSCTSADVWSLDTSTDRPVAPAGDTAGAASEETRGFPDRYGLLIEKMRSSQEVLRLSNLTNDRWAVSDVPDFPPLRSFLAVPMLDRGQVQRWLCVGDKLDGGEFTEEDELIMRALASHAMSALANASSLDELRRAISVLEGQVVEDEDAPNAIDSRSMKAVCVFAARVAHDFNNWLTAIIGYSQMGLARVEASPLKRELEQIERAGVRAAGVTQKLLAFSRKQVLHPSVVGLNDVISNLARPISTIVGKGIQVVTHLDPGLKPTRADRDQLEQMIRDLVANARDAMADGGKLVIETSNQERDDLGSCVLLVVSDTGIGIDPAVLPRIFEPFFTTKSSAERSGLGLSTVYGFVRQSGGAIDVESRPGMGTTFRIYFPQAQGASLKSEQAAAVPASKRTILVVDDEDIARGLVREVLKRGGYGVLEARDGVEAIAICDNHEGPIDLMLTDMNMPKINGNRLVQDLSRIRPDTKVLYSSGGFVGPDLTNGAMPPMLHKPFTPDQLLNKVEEVLTGGRRSIAGTTI